ncbi:MAG: aldose 1-epimerase family protein [Chloroflexota bacterium]|nr:aldose 1-epimerase family protein [Chloroflexota bacterium]
MPRGADGSGSTLFGRPSSPAPANDWSPFTGWQIEIRHGLQRAMVVEVGAGLREYEVDGQPVLDGYASDTMAEGGAGLPLLPWPNRLADGEYVFEGQALRLPIDDVTRRNAMHGLTRWLNWRVADQAVDAVRMELILHPRMGYPFALRLSIEYTLGANGLGVRTEAHNVGKRALPFGAGQHPYLTVSTPFVDTAILELPAHARVELDPERMLPTGALLRVDTPPAEYDFRTARPVGPLVLDDCFAQLDRENDGLARARLSHPLSGRKVTMWLDASYGYLQVFSGETLPPARRRRSLAIEPMSCPPNAFRTGADLIVLQPDETRSLAWGLTCTV